MTTLTGTLTLRRAVLSEVVEDANTEPRIVVSGSSSSLQGGAGSGQVDETMQTGEFRQYGNGSTRLILGSATQRSRALALIALKPSEVAVVRSLLGHKVCFRDIYGRKVFGSFLDMQENAIPFSGKSEEDTLLVNVGLTIVSVSHDEAV